MISLHDVLKFNSMINNEAPYSSVHNFVVSIDDDTFKLSGINMHGKIPLLIVDIF